MSISEWFSIRKRMPSMTDRPSPPAVLPSTLSAKNGIMKPPISRPIPFTVSDTATAFRPPKIA